MDSALKKFDFMVFKLLHTTVSMHHDQSHVKPRSGALSSTLIPQRYYASNSCASRFNYECSPKGICDWHAFSIARNKIGIHNPQRDVKNGAVYRKDTDGQTRTCVLCNAHLSYCCLVVVSVNVRYIEENIMALHTQMLLWSLEKLAYMQFLMIIICSLKSAMEELAAWDKV